ncbi:MAG: hypothetical protein NVS1B2_24240 [Vulcanimicrobiaceae bacterium]
MLGGFTLRGDSPHSTTDGSRRWPVIDGIAFVRVGRERLAADVLAALDAGDRITALALLLGDRDDWDPTTAPSLDVRRAIARDIATLTFRDAMDALGFGGVATYFAHRWSDPTFVAGLGLIAAHRPRHATRSFEIACGVGHYLRELARVGVDATGGDVVFAKLWLARHFIAPTARLICFDAATSWPIASSAYDFVHVHDALYFLPRKDHVASEMRRIAAPGGTIAVSHAHNATVDNFSAGAPLDRAGYTALFPSAIFYDDRAFADAVVRGAVPDADVPETAPAYAFVDGPTANDPLAGEADVALPSPGTPLVRNPLYAADGGTRIVWPSERYEREYAAFATYPVVTSAPAVAEMSDDPQIVAMARTRELVALPERW